MYEHDLNMRLVVQKSSDDFAAGKSTITGGEQVGATIPLIPLSC